VFVAAPVVDPQVNWSLWSNLASFGCTNAIGLGMPIAYAFLERIVDEEVRPGRCRSAPQVDSFVGSPSRKPHPQAHRTARSKGPMGEVPPTGRPVRIAYIQVLRFRYGKHVSLTDVRPAFRCSNS